MRTEFSNVPSEGALVSAILGRDSFDPNSLPCSPHHFADPRFGNIYQAMCSVASTDLTLIQEKLQEYGTLDRVWSYDEDLDERFFGVAALRQLAAKLPVSTEVLYEYANIIRDRAGKREIAEAFAQAEELLHDKGIPDALAYMSGAVTGFRAEHGQRGTGAGEALQEALAQLTDEASHYVTWPLKALTSRGAPGYSPGHFLVVAGYSNHGKTVLLSQFADAACLQGKKVAYCPLEMSPQEMTLRMLHKCGMTPDEIVRTPKPYKHVQERIREMASFDLTFHECYSMEDILTVAESRRPDVLIVDHLHRLPWADHKSLENYCREFKNIAMKNRLAVVLGAQLIKPSADRGADPPRPTVYFLKGSGAIEQEADTILFLWRPHTIEGHKGKATEIMVYKMRHGESDWSFHTEFDPRTLTFKENS